MKLHGTQTFCEIAWLQTSVLGLEEDKITWHSNYYHTKTSPLHGLEEKEIAVTQTLENHECAGLGKDEITWYLNWHTRVLFRFRRRNYRGLKRMLYFAPRRFEGLEENRITWYSNQSGVLLTFLLGLEEDKITWYSNTRSGVTVGRRFRRRWNYMALKPA